MVAGACASLAGLGDPSDTPPAEDAAAITDAAIVDGGPTNDAPAVDGPSTDATWRHRLHEPGLSDDGAGRNGHARLRLHVGGPSRRPGRRPDVVDGRSSRKALWSAAMSECGST
jgi:hypothetical protein